MTRDGAAPTPLPTARPLCVLIVDGNAAIRRHIRETLEAARYQVLEATDGADALTILCLLRERAVALIGAELPDMRLAEVLGAIRTLPDLRSAGHVYLLMSDADATATVPVAVHQAAEVVTEPILSRPPRVHELYHHLACAVVRMVAPSAAWADAPRH